MHEVSRTLNDDVIVQLSRQIGAQDPNQVKRASQAISELLVEALSRNVNRNGGQGLYGAIERDHDGGILGDLVNIFSGKSQVNNPKTMNGAGILNHILGKKQLEAAQVVSQMSGLDFFKSGVLMQLIAPVIMGLLGKQQRSNKLDLGGLASILLGGGQRQQPQQQRSSGGLFGKLLDMDGDGNMMDDLLNIGMKILKK